MENNENNTAPSGVSERASGALGALAGLMPQSSVESFNKGFEEAQATPNVPSENNVVPNTGNSNEGQVQQPEGSESTGEGASMNDLPGGESPAAGPSDNEFVIESPLLGGKKNIGNPNEGVGTLENSVNFETIDDISSYLKEELGIDELTSLPDQIKVFKEQAETVSNLSTKVTNAENVFKNLDPDLYKAVVNNVNGKDWRNDLQSNSVDFSKNKSDYTDQQLVESIMPGKLTSEDWEQFNDEDGDPAVKRLVQNYIDTASKSFDEKKSSIEASAQESIVKAQERSRLFKESIDASKNALKESFGNVDSALVSEIEDAFTNTGINSVFYDEKGMLKSDAMVRFALAKHGAELIEQYKKIAEHKIETAINQEILTRGADTPNVSKGSNAVGTREEVRPGVQRAIDEIRGLI